MERSEVFIVVLTAGLIFLSAMLLTTMLEGNQVAARNWSVDVLDDSASWNNLFIGDDGTLYTTGGRTIYAIDEGGNILWSITDPDPEDLFSDASHLALAGATSDQTNTYLLITAEDLETIQDDTQLLAISPGGKILWHKPAGNGYHSVNTVAGHVYLFSGTRVDVYDSDGSLLWTVNSVFDVPGIDEKGHLYVINRGYDVVPQVESVRAYSDDGSLLWSHNISEYNIEWLNNACDTMPVYNNGTLYIWAPGTAIALDTEGRMKWAYGYNNGMARPMSIQTSATGSGVSETPFDSTGRLYYSYQRLEGDPRQDKSQWVVSIVNPNGTEAASYVVLDPGHRGNFFMIADGVAYYYEQPESTQNQTIEDLNNCRINAYSMITGNMLWSTELPVFNQNKVTLNRSSARQLLKWNDPVQAVEINGQILKKAFEPADSGSSALPWKNESMIRVAAGRDQLYLSYWTYNYEYPVVYNTSTCVYSGGLYAIGKDGRLLWNSSTDSFVTTLKTKNDTLFYQTNSGRMSVITSGATAGLIATIVYLLLRVFVAGTVTRARSQLNKNQNRNEILRYICDSPGPTQHEVARHLGINLGTVRYHLLVLSLNHKITTYTDETKFIRYFKNSHSYSEEEKLVIALIRREPIRKLLTLLLEGRCSSNIEMARELNMPESAVSKYLRELQACKVVIKGAGNREAAGYMIGERYRTVLKECLANQYFL